MEEGYAGRELWEDEGYYRASAPPMEKEWVWVDAHLMTTPSIADINGDGIDEMVMAVSYLFDRDQYADPVSFISCEGLYSRLCETLSTPKDCQWLLTVVQG